MKHWKWETDKSSFAPVLVCPYCSATYSPVFICFSNFSHGVVCPMCSKRILPPEKDYWESMKEGEQNE